MNAAEVTPSQENDFQSLWRHGSISIRLLDLVFCHRKKNSRSSRSFSLNIVLSDALQAASSVAMANLVSCSQKIGI